MLGTKRFMLEGTSLGAIVLTLWIAAAVGGFTERPRSFLKRTSMYSSEALCLRDGKFALSFSSCTHSSVVSVGHYRSAGKELELEHLWSGLRERIALDGWEESDSGTPGAARGLPKTESRRLLYTREPSVGNVQPGDANPGWSFEIDSDEPHCVAQDGKVVSVRGDHVRLSGRHFRTGGPISEIQSLLGPAESKFSFDGMDTEVQIWHLEPFLLLVAVNNRSDRIEEFGLRFQAPASSDVNRAAGS